MGLRKSSTFMSAWDHHLAGGKFAEAKGPLEDPPLEVVQHPRLVTLPHEDFELLDRVHPRDVLRPAPSRWCGG